MAPFRLPSQKMNLGNVSKQWQNKRLSRMGSDASLGSDTDMIRNSEGPAIYPEMTEVVIKDRKGNILDNGGEVKKKNKDLMKNQSSGLCNVGPMNNKTPFGLLSVKPGDHPKVLKFKYDQQKAENPTTYVWDVRKIQGNEANLLKRSKSFSGISNLASLKLKEEEHGSRDDIQNAKDEMQVGGEDLENVDSDEEQKAVVTQIPKLPLNQLQDKSSSEETS